jgi:hypothetical protein
MSATASRSVDRPVQVQISDLDLAAALVSLGCTRFLGHVPTSEPGREEFVLAGDRDVVASLTARFAMGDLLVEPRAFAAARRALQRQLRTEPSLNPSAVSTRDPAR